MTSAVRNDGEQLLTRVCGIVLGGLNVEVKRCATEAEPDALAEDV
ncbi:MAG: hypothetical protein ACYCU0_05610 [Solirubrobacteraceae bacterium]